MNNLVSPVPFVSHVDNIFSFTGLLQLTGSLVLVIILIFGVFHLFRKKNLNFLKDSLPYDKQDKPIDIIYSLNISPTHSLKLIKIDQTIVLIGVTPHSMNFLKEFSVYDSIVLEEKCRNKNGGHFLKVLLSNVNDYKKEQKDLKKEHEQE